MTILRTWLCRQNCSAGVVYEDLALRFVAKATSCPSNHRIDLIYIVPLILWRFCFENEAHGQRWLAALLGNLAPLTGLGSTLNLLFK